MSNNHSNNDPKDSDKQANQPINNNSSSSSSSSSSNSNSNNAAKNNAKYIESLHTFDLYNTDPNPSLQNTSNQANPDALLKESPSDPSTQDFVPTGLRSIHDTTKIIADAKNSSTGWDWNKLPSRDAKCLKSISNYNLISIEIDGQIKQLQYLPSYNHMLPLLDIFYAFNKESKTVDSLIFSKQRLKSSAEVIVTTLKSNHRASSLAEQVRTNLSPGSTISGNVNNGDSNILLSLSKSSLINNYTSTFSSDIFEDPKDLTNHNSNLGHHSEVDIVIHLWHLQLQKFLLQKSSLFYSNEALQSLLKRKSFARNLSKNNQQNFVSDDLNKDTLTVRDNTDQSQHRTIDKNVSKFSKNVQEHLDEIDILVIRPPLAYLTGLQLAFDEPSLNVVDFQLHSISWISKNLTKDLLINTNGEINKTYSSMIKIASNESELEILTKENAHLYMVNCLAKPFPHHNVDSDTDSVENNSIYSGRSDSTNEYLLSMLPPLMKRDSYDTITHDTYSNISNNANTTTDINIFTLQHVEKSDNVIKEENIVPKKKSSTKKSSIVNFFRRKHHSQTQLQAEQTKITQQQQHAKVLSHHRSSISNQCLSNTSTANASGNHHKTLSARNGNSPLIRALSPNRNLTLKDSAFHQTLWLEEHFCELLNNYKKIEMPTQYYLPRDSGSPLFINKSSSSPYSSSSSSLKDDVEGIDKKVRSGKSYNRQFLQLRLPFADNSIPAIYCPWVWGILPRKRWHVLTKELFRILEHEGYVLAVQADLSPTNTNPRDSKFQTAVAREKIFDSVTINAIHQNIFTHPTQHLSNIFKEHGFINIKASTLSLKLGDCETEMGCLNEFACLMAINFMFRQEMNYQKAGNKDPGEIIEQYYKEHWSQVDDQAGTFRISYIVAQKPKKSIAF